MTSTATSLVDLLNAAKSTGQSASSIIKVLDTVKERLLYGESNLENDEFLEYFRYILEFQHDSHFEVRNWVVFFAIEAGRKRASLLPQIYLTLQALFGDENHLVVKNVIHANTSLYRYALQHLASVTEWADEHNMLWLGISEIKDLVLDQLCPTFTHPNEGVRNHVLAYMMSLVLSYTRDSLVLSLPTKEEEVFSLSLIPYSHSHLKVVDLMGEGNEVLERLIAEVAGDRLSMTNLCVAITNLAIIARKRPQHTQSVMTALLALNSVPERFTQESAKYGRVKHTLKSQMLQLAKLPSCQKWIPVMHDLLVELGYEAEVKAAKRQVQAAASAALAGKQHKVVTRENIQKQRITDPAPKLLPQHTQFLHQVSKLPPDLCAALCMQSSTHFTPPEDYTPGPEGAYSTIFTTFLKQLDVSDNYFDLLPVEQSSRLELEQVEEFNDTLPTPLTAGLVPAVPLLHFNHTQSNKMAEGAVTRILSDRTSQDLKRAGQHASLLRDSVVTRFYNFALGPMERFMSEWLLKHILEDFVARQELAQRWLFCLLTKRPLSVLFPPVLPALPLDADPVQAEDANEAQDMDTSDIPYLDPPPNESSSSSSSFPNPSSDASSSSSPLDESSSSSSSSVDSSSSSSPSTSSFLSSTPPPKLEPSPSDTTLSSTSSISASSSSSSSTTKEESSASIATAAEDKRSLELYENTLDCMLQGLVEKSSDDKSFETLFRTFIIEIPLLTKGTMNVIQDYCQADERKRDIGLLTLRDLILHRSSRRALDTLLEFTVHVHEELRDRAVKLVANKLFPLEQLSSPIERFAKTQLGKVVKESTLALYPVLPAPAPKEPVKVDVSSAEDVSKMDKRAQKKAEWLALKQRVEKQAVEQAEKNREAREVRRAGEIKRFLSLFCALCTKTHSLVEDVLVTYAEASAFVRTQIHKETPPLVKTIKMSPSLLQAINRCPTGSEPLVLHIMRVLSEIRPPLKLGKLVQIARNLYQRKQDSKFLIPILSELPKDEVKQALPKLVMLQSVQAKDAITQLLNSAPVPLTPTELMVCLHSLDFGPKKTPQHTSMLRQVIELESLCFQKKELYTEEVLASVLQLLIDQNPLPALFMRTLMQTLVMCPKLSGFGIHLMQKLVTRKVWIDPDLWRGFIKCAQKTQPDSLAILVHLPRTQLQDVLQVAGDLREPLQKWAKLHPNGIPRANLAELQVSERRTEPIKTEAGVTTEGAKKLEDSSRVSQNHEADREIPATAENGNGNHARNPQEYEEPKDISGQKRRRGEDELDNIRVKRTDNRADPHHVDGLERKLHTRTLLNSQDNEDVQIKQESEGQEEDSKPNGYSNEN